MHDVAAQDVLDGQMGSGLNINSDQFDAGDLLMADGVGGIQALDASTLTHNVPEVHLDGDNLYIIKDGEKHQVATIGPEGKGHIDLGGMDLRGASFNKDTRIDVRTWKAMALLGCVEGYEEEKAASAAKQKDKDQ